MTLGPPPTIGNYRDQNEAEFEICGENEDESMEDSSGVRRGNMVRDPPAPRAITGYRRDRYFGGFRFSGIDG